MPAADSALPFLYDKIVRGCRRLWVRVIRPYWLLILGGLLALTAVEWAYQQWVRPLLHRKVVVYTSSPGADSYVLGQQAADGFRPKDAPWLVTYEFEVRESQGLRENRGHVQKAKPGELVIGFDQDGFEPPENVRTLLPLTAMHLHAIARRADAEKARPDPAGPPTLGRLREWLRKNPPQREDRRLLCYLGPPDSGTRQIAERVLRHYQIDPVTVDAGGHFGFREAYEHLKAGRLDVVFDGSDLGSKSIEERAREGAFALVGLDDVDGLVAGQNSMRKERVPRGTYGSGNGFCVADIDTVSTQRLIICPRSMSNSDAYYLTDGIQEALRDKVPTISWDKQRVPAPGPGLMVPLHPGVEDYRQGRTPWFWRAVTEYWWVTLTTVLGFVVWLLQRQATPPTLAGLPEEPVIVPAGGSSPVRFTVDDAETPPAELRVTAEASDPALFPALAVKPGGADKERVLELTPARDGGGATITVTVADASGRTARGTFRVTVAAAPAAGAPAPPPRAAEPAVAADPPPLASELREVMSAGEALLRELSRAPAAPAPNDVRRWERRLAAVNRQLADAFLKLGSEHAGDVAVVQGYLFKVRSELDGLREPGRAAAGSH